MADPANRQPLYKPVVGLDSTGERVGVLDILADQNYAATVTGGIVFLSPHREGECVNPHEVFIAALQDGLVTDPTAGGTQYSSFEEKMDLAEQLQNEEIRQRGWFRVFEGVGTVACYTTTSLHASTPQPTYF